MSDKKTRIVACPNCKKDSIFGEQNPYRPFCSERCHLIDLGLWANEEFKIATPLDPNLLDDDFQSH
jgi:endogenous inhibitor of DNA gyrase (YacG/DUF329 family)